MSPRGIGAALVATVLAAACGGDPTGSVDRGRTAPPAVGSCRAGETPPLQGGSHLLGDTEPPVPYSSTPPTSGWHAAGAPPAPGVADTELSGPQQVSVLEAGGVVAAYDPDRLPADQVADLEALATGSLAPRLTVTPYRAGMPSPLTLTAWGVLQRCEAVDADAVTTFVVTYGGATVAEH